MQQEQESHLVELEEGKRYFVPLVGSNNSSNSLWMVRKFEQMDFFNQVFFLGLGVLAIVFLFRMMLPTLDDDEEGNDEDENDEGEEIACTTLGVCTDVGAAATLGAGAGSIDGTPGW